MHEYRKLIQAELDRRGWRQSELARRGGLGRSVINKILNDDRPHLGQMPDDSTMDGIATGFGIPVERVRQAAARSLVGYVETGDPADPLDNYSTEYLLDVIKSRLSDGDSLPFAARREKLPKEDDEV